MSADTYYAGRRAAAKAAAASGDAAEPVAVARAPGFYADVPEQEYHGDRDSLSVSGAKTLLKAPALFRWQQDHPVHKDVFDFGSAAHALVLGAGMESIYIAPYNDWTKRKGPEGGVQYTTDEKRIAQEDGLSPILPKEWLKVCDMAAALASHRLAMRLLSEGRPEVSAYAPDEATGVMRRCRFDWLGSTIVTDYKTADSADPDLFVKTAVNFGYHMQHPYYLDLAADLGHPAAAFAFIVQEKTEPYLVTVVELPPELVDIGRARNRRALERFRDCTESGLWPGYVSDDTFAQPAAPRWALYQEMTA
ncbi:MAG: PD-(D/E)XK nuclease-like domain-containing protein [Mycobacteriales bacterium]